MDATASLSTPAGRLAATSRLTSRGMTVYSSSMLVDVVQMRVQGERLSVAQLKAAPIVRGQLGVFVRRDMHRGSDVVCAMLEGDFAGQFRLPVLDHMRLTRMRGESFVLIGFQEVRQRRNTNVFPQAWWCRVVCEATGESALLDDAEVESVSSVF